MKAYLNGEVYSMNFVHSEIFPEFLNIPENRTNGRTTMGITVLTDFAS